MAKPYAIAFYHSKAWKKCRAGYIKSVNGLCERCLNQKPKRYVPGKIVHHIKYITPENINDPNITLAWDNLELLCQDCHNIEHHGTGTEIRDDVMFDTDGNLIPR